MKPDPGAYSERGWTGVADPRSALPVEGLDPYVWLDAHEAKRAMAYTDREFYAVERDDLLLCRILRFIAEHAPCVREDVEITGYSRVQVDRHLRMLWEEGLWQDQSRTPHQVPYGPFRSDTELAQAIDRYCGHVEQEAKETSAGILGEGWVWLLAGIAAAAGSLLALLYHFFLR